VFVNGHDRYSRANLSMSLFGAEAEISQTYKLDGVWHKTHTEVSIGFPYCDWRTLQASVVYGRVSGDNGLRSDANASSMWNGLLWT
jgi:hypothetical protein